MRCIVLVQDQFLVRFVYLPPLTSHLVRLQQCPIIDLLISERHEVVVYELVPSLLHAYLDTTTQVVIIVPIMGHLGEPEHAEQQQRTHILIDLSITELLLHINGLELMLIILTDDLL